MLTTCYFNIRRSSNWENGSNPRFLWIQDQKMNHQRKNIENINVHYVRKVIQHLCLWNGTLITCMSMQLHYLHAMRMDVARVSKTNQSSEFILSFIQLHPRNVHFVTNFFILNLGLKYTSEVNMLMMTKCCTNVNNVTKDFQLCTAMKHIWMITKTSDHISAHYVKKLTATVLTLNITLSLHIQVLLKKRNM